MNLKNIIKSLILQIQFSTDYELRIIAEETILNKFEEIEKYNLQLENDLNKSNEKLTQTLIALNKAQILISNNLQRQNNE